MPENNRDKLARIVLIVGLCLMLSFFAVGILNIIRGYSIQSFVPSYIFLLGFLLTLFANQPMPVMRGSVKNSLVCTTLFIFHMIPGFYQGKFFKEAEKFYAGGQYSEALDAAAYETDLWFLRIGHNHSEVRAWDLLAKCYCQQEQFDKAVEIYQQIIEYYPDSHYAQASQERIDEIKESLAIVKYYPDRLEDYCLEVKKVTEVDENDKYFALMDIAREYSSPLNCEKKAIEVYELAISLNVGESLKKSARKEAGRLKERHNVAFRRI